MKYYIILIAISLYSTTMIGQNPTNSGNLSDGFRITRSSPKGNPFLSSEWYVGYGINEDGSTTRPQQMNYDIHGNNLVYKTGTNGETMKLIDDSFKGFILKNKNSELLFSKINGDKFEREKRQTRYFQILSPPSQFVIIEYTKDLNDPNASGWTSSKDNTLSSEYDLNTKYYVLNDENLYTEVKLKRNSILRALKEKKDELKAYITSNKLDFDSEMDLVQLMQFYHSL